MNVIKNRKAVNVALNNFQHEAGKLMEHVTLDSQYANVAKQVEEIQGMLNNLREEVAAATAFAETNTWHA